MTKIHFLEGRPCQDDNLRSIISHPPEGGHGGRVATLAPPTSEAGVRLPARPKVGKLIVACLWSAVYSTEP